VKNKHDFFKSLLHLEKHKNKVENLARMFQSMSSRRSKISMEKIPENQCIVAT
jgi:hypothetical protein